MSSRRVISSGLPSERTFGYSRAVQVGNQLFVSGTVGRNADGSPAVGGYTQTKRALQIIQAVLAEVGATLDQVVRTRVFVTDVALFDEVSTAHGEVFGAIRPASTLVAIQGLVEGYLVEIEADVVIG
jgi:enamine deaminase RidA (YjgF/YER057c/UK114 family)